MTEIRDWLALAALPGLGGTLVSRLLARFGSPERILAAGKAVAEVEGVGPRLAAVFEHSASLAQARAWAVQEQKRAADLGVHLLACDDPQYPPLLRTIHDPPPLLWCRGDLACLQPPGIALVGSRNATSYGQKVSFLLAKQLTQTGLTVISGLAAGIDGCAHAGALEGGSTIAVLGCGVDVVYPRLHSRLCQQILTQGLLLSECPLGTQPDGFRFPARNRIISGLSLGVVVVEAAAKSGSLITARMALEQNREVFAVPGRIDSPQSEGCHSLIRQGAQLVHSVDDILAELPLDADKRKAAAQPDAVSVPLSEPERSLLALFGDSPLDIEELTEQSRMPVSALHGLLLELELKGLLRQLPGQQYERMQAGCF